MEIDSIGLHLPSHKMGGQGRKTIIPLFSPKRYRRCQEPDFPTEERLSSVQPLSLASLDKAGLRLPASAALRLRLAGRCPNSSSLFPPLAAVVAVAPGRGASGETVHFAGPCRRGYFSNLFREFVENARVKREEFVNVIKMRRRY